MSELLRRAEETLGILKKKPWLRAPNLRKKSKNVNVVGQHLTQQHLRAYLREADPATAHLHPPLPDIEDNGQLRLLTRRLLGMRHEFRSYNKTGEEERRDFLKAGIIGTGIAAAGGLAGLGLYKAGVSGAAQKAAQIGGELNRARKSLRGIRDWKLAKVAAAKNAESVSRVAAKKSIIANANAGIDAQKFRAERIKDALKSAKEAGKTAPTAPAPVVVKAPVPVANVSAPKKVAPTAPVAPVKVTPAEIAAENTEKIAEKIAATPAKVASKAVEPKVASAPQKPATPKPTPVAISKAPGFWQSPDGKIKIPLNGDPVHDAALTKKFDELHGSGGFKGKVAADVIDEARDSVAKSLKASKSDFPEGLSDRFREVGRANNENLKPTAGKGNNPPQSTKKSSKSQKAKDEGWDDPDASPEEAEWEAAYNAPETTVKTSKSAPKGKRAATPNAAEKAPKSETKSTPKGKGAATPEVSASNYETPPLSPIQIRKLQAARRAKKANRAAKAEAAAKAAAKNKRKGNKNLAARLRRVLYFDQFQTDEGGIPLTGRVPRDRFVKKIRDEDLDRRDANLLRAGGAGALAGALARGRIGVGKRALIGAGIGGLGVLGIRAITHNDRDIYGERNRGSKKAEIIPAVGGLGAAAWLAGKRLKAFATKFNHNRAPGQAGGRATEGWPRRGETSGSERVKGHRGGMKHFDDYRLYYFKGRNTGIAAKSVEEARSKKKRGGDELVAVRTPSDSEKSQMARGVWVRTRRDGKSPQKSRYGKGRGQGPARKSISAKLRLKEFSVVDTARRAAKAVGGWAKRNGTAIGLTGAGVGASVAASRYYGPSNKGWKKLDEQKQFAVKFFEKRDRREKRELNPYVGAALSGGVSGAGLGALSWLKRGTSVASAGKMAAKLGALSAGVVGGGALIGSRIVGDPRKEEGAPFMKRVALGGAITGALVGGTGGLLLRNTKLVREAAKTWRPAKWIVDAPALGAGALGAVGGAVVGAAQGADEGQQVDSIRNLRKDIKQKNFSRLMEFRAFPELAAKQVWKTDPALRANFVKRVVAKVKEAVAANKKQYPVKEFQVSPLNVESMAQTKERRSARDKWKKRHNLARKLRGLKMFGRDDQPRHRESKAWADPIMGWIRGDDLVDKDGNKWSPSSPQLVNAMHNKARGIRVKVQRGAGLAGDTTAVLQGKDRERDASGRIKKREWEKAWFRNAMTTAGLTVAGLAGAGAWRYGRMNPGTALGKFVANTEKGVRRTKDDVKSGLGRLMGAADDATGPKKFSVKLKKLREFDLFASSAGWDTRDPRGRSVRVYAPGSRTRVRREKYWHEKADNQRKLMIAAGVGAAAIGGLGGVAVYRLAKGKSLVPSFMLKKPPAPQAAVSKFQISPEEMKSKVDAMSKKAQEEAARRAAARAAAVKANAVEPNPMWWFRETGADVA